MTTPLIKIEAFTSVGVNVFHAHAEFHHQGYRGGNGAWFLPSAQLNIHQPGETEENAFYPAQSISFRVSPQKAQALSAYFAKLARQLTGVEAV